LLYAAPMASKSRARTGILLGLGTSLLLWASCTPGDVLVGGGGDDDGAPPDPEPDGPTLPPPPPEFGVVTAPRTGDTIDDQGAAARVVVEGLHTAAGAEVEVLALVAPYDRATSWRVIATGVTGAAAEPGDPDEPRYPFRLEVDASAVWPRAGLLSLRVRAGGRDLAGFFAEAEACWEGVASWRERVPRCGSPFTSAGIVLASTDLPRDDQVALDARYLDDKGRVTPSDTAAYYQAIDAPATVAEFRARYVIDDRVDTTYYNVGDLGIGREMHCGTFPSGGGTGVGCYVANYGTFGGSRAQALNAAIRGSQNGGSSGEFATVAMVYRPPVTAPNAVQFVVYGADETLVTEAVLDTHGDNASIPNNCLNCHGSHGEFDAATRSVRNARFLPFDPAAFAFADVPGFRRSDQEDALRRLNALILRTEPPPGIVELVQGMYAGTGGVAAAGAVADVDFVPPGWASPGRREAYREVVAPFCRSCHASREVGGASEMYDFTDSVRFSSIAFGIAATVCGGGTEDVHRMPNAEAAQLAFWRSPARAYLGAMIDLRGPCTP